MVSTKFDRGSIVHCVEHNTEHNFSGTLNYTADRVLLRLHSYFGEIDFPGFNPVLVRTESNEFVALYGTSHVGSGGVGLNNSGKLHVRNYTVHAGMLVAGGDFWSESRPVKRIQFRIPRLEQILEFSPKHKAIRYSSWRSSINDQLFAVRCQNLMVRVRYNLSWVGDDEYPTTVEPYLEIEKSDGIELGDCYSLIRYVVSFFSMLHARRLNPFELKISELTRAAFHRLQNRDDQNRQDEHRLIFVKTREQSGTPIHQRQIFFLGGKAISDFKKCLSVWISRRTKWSTAAVLMEQSLSLQNEFSGNRLMTACRWFEGIPIVSSKSIIKKSDAKCIGRVAEAFATELGYDAEIAGQVCSSVSGIKRETRRLLFRRLTESLKSLFGNDLINGQFLTDLEYAYRHRQSAAHSVLKFDNPQEELNALRGTMALELLCLMLTIRDLPLSNRVFETFEMDDRVDKYKRLFINPQ